jgi:hypothetical protein
MDQATAIHDDPFLAALRELSGMHLLTPAIAEALLHLPAQAFDARRANGEPVPPLMTADGKWGYLAGDLVQYVDQVPTRRGPIKIHHASFAGFLTHGQPADVWVFGMVALDFQGMRRPVDLMTCLELPATLLADVNCQHMGWKDYVEAMDHYLSGFRDQQEAEALATERAQRALRLAPGKKTGRTANRDRS